MSFQDFLNHILSREGVRRLLDAHSSKKYTVKPRRFRNFPTIDLEKCVVCGACADACPVGPSDGKPPALEMTDKGPVLHEDRCIRCGLCAEVCPVSAIQVGTLHEEREEVVKPPKPAEIAVDPDLCIGCGRCERVCPSDAIHVIDGTAEVDRESCVLCEACIDACPVAGAIKLLPMDVEELRRCWTKIVDTKRREVGSR
ncbi:MAG: 4Fe-4S dicluster domain-containing protein [Methanopyri archaeon]|nr:4Fe-4S dicluster domain-containing protein [Methanopyri archaeon]